MESLFHSIFPSISYPGSLKRYFALVNCALCAMRRSNGVWTRQSKTKGILLQLWELNSVFFFLFDDNDNDDDDDDDGDHFRYWRAVFAVVFVFWHHFCPHILAAIFYTSWYTSLVNRTFKQQRMKTWYDIQLSDAYWYYANDFKKSWLQFKM